MKHSTGAAALMVLFAVGAALPALAEEQKAKTSTFDADAADKPPAGFSFGRRGEGAPGRWIVRGAKDAPSGGQVLAQVDADSTDYRFPVAVADNPSLAD